MTERPDGTAPVPPDSVAVPIRDESIRLGQALKLADLVEDGVEAKAVISEGLVSVNGESEVRRGRQLRAGDWFELRGISAVISADRP